MNMWQGSKLIGLNVYDTQNEKIGDIKELMVDKEGKIEQVAIGVGGFLGMGEHDVAVKWTELKFSDQPVPSKTSSATGGAARTTGAASTSTSSSTSSSKKNYPDHATLNTTKDQLKAMPQFNYNK
jgi:sporulation protein YlmC with PRC-barrel domain